jgi:hypothetical protein
LMDSLSNTSNVCRYVCIKSAKYRCTSFNITCIIPRSSIVFVRQKGNTKQIYGKCHDKKLLSICIYVFLEIR